MGKDSKNKRPSYQDENRRHQAMRATSHLRFPIGQRQAKAQREAWLSDEERIEATEWFLKEGN